ncbi:MAG: hypothetical protein LBH65_06580 [Desulfovibrio sp.]|jgi:hypothetical protein|nr:hypothetical protein [Desulfovibrio sp.]
MNICTSSESIDALEEIRDVIAFMREAICQEREPPFSDGGLCGAQLCVWALEKDVMTVRDLMKKST